MTPPAGRRAHLQPSGGGRGSVPCLRALINQVDSSARPRDCVERLQSSRPASAAGSKQRERERWLLACGRGRRKVATIEGRDNGRRRARASAVERGHRKAGVGLPAHELRDCARVEAATSIVVRSIKELCKRTSRWPESHKHTQTLKRRADETRSVSVFVNRLGPNGRLPCQGNCNANIPRLGTAPSPRESAARFAWMHDFAGVANRSPSV
jgi:hypothetical protein